MHLTNLSLIENETKQDTVMRDAVPAKVKLAATIRYLAMRVTYSDLQYTFRIHKSMLSRVVRFVMLSTQD